MWVGGTVCVEWWMDFFTRELVHYSSIVWMREQEWVLNYSFDQVLLVALCEERWFGYWAFGVLRAST